MINQGNKKVYSMKKHVKSQKRVLESSKGFDGQFDEVV